MLRDALASSSPNGRTRLLSGLEVLAAVPLLQREIDRRRGLETGGLVTGYRGSPLAGLDKLLQSARAELSTGGVSFLPALNEEIAVSMLEGSQDAFARQDATVEGAFGFWYGKSPGLARAVDALRHANLVGAWRLGGVVLWVGDDPQAISSRYTHTSELLLRDAFLPILTPSSPQEILDFSILGVALSRHSGLWTSLLVESDIVDTRQLVDLSPERLLALLPSDRGVGVRLSINEPAGPAEALQCHERLPRAKRWLERTFPVMPSPAWGPGSRLLVLAAGQTFNVAHGAVRALSDNHPAAGVDEAVSLVPLPYVWPTPPLRTFWTEAMPRHVLVVENGRLTLTEALRAAAYGMADGPAITAVQDYVGPSAQVGTPPSQAEIVTALAKMLDLPWLGSGKDLSVPQPIAPRAPFFCAGCPCNLSTRVPDGTLSFGGVGCHLIDSLAPEGQSQGLPQMGGEGASWIGRALFTPQRHAFQLLGDGTYFHSGSLAIRAALAAGTTMTFKILVNGVVAMTGGQRIEGRPSPLDLARQIRAEGVETIVVVGDREDLPPASGFPPGTRFAPRATFLSVQEELSNTTGVSVILFVRPCATFRRRAVSRADWAAAPAVAIDPEICEGCDDCVVRSRCIAIDRVDTALGVKRQITPTICNRDLLCLAAECPALITVAPAPSAVDARQAVGFWPSVACALPPTAILVAGVGGAGVLKATRLLCEAAGRAGLRVSAYSDPGLSQRGGVVLGHIRIVPVSDPLPRAGRLAPGSADLLICTDPLTAAQPSVLQLLKARDASTVVVGSFELQQRNGILTREPTATTRSLAAVAFKQLKARASRVHHVTTRGVPAEDIGTALLGAALARGLLPMPVDHLQAEADPFLREALANSLHAHAEQDAAFDQIKLASIAELGERLVAYGDPHKLRRFRQLADRTAAALIDRNGSANDDLALRLAHVHYRLLAVKDACEVARLLLDRRRRVAETDIAYHLQLWPSWMGGGKTRIPTRLARPFLGLLASLRYLRGTTLDVTRLLPDASLMHRVSVTFEREVTSAMALPELTRRARLEAIATHVAMVKGFGSVRRRSAEGFLQSTSGASCR